MDGQAVCGSTDGDAEGNAVVVTDEVKGDRMPPPVVAGANVLVAEEPVLTGPL